MMNSISLRIPRIRIAFLLVAISALPLLQAAEAPAPGGPDAAPKTNLEDYLARAALNNPGLRSAFEEWKAALERAPQVSALPDPRFTYQYFIEQVETRVGPQRQSVGLAQTFPWFGKLRLRGDAATEAARTAWQRYEATKLGLFYRVKRAYYEYYYLARSLDTIREQKELLTQFEEVARIRYETAGESHSSVIRSQVELGKLEDRLRTLEDLRTPIVADLNAAMNRPVEKDLPWPKRIPSEKLTATDGEILALFRETNPELKALAHEIARSEANVKLARREYFPDFTLGVTYIDTEEARMPNVDDSGKDPVVAMVSINLPIWFQKYRANEREAKARRRSAVLKKENLEKNLGARIKRSLYEYRDAERKIDLYRNALVPKALQSLNATETAFRAGEASFTALLDAERILLEFQLSLERALANRAQRLAELEMYLGQAVPTAAAEDGEDSENAESESN